jgi:hypothetical protein
MEPAVAGRGLEFGYLAWFIVGVPDQRRLLLLAGDKP